MKKWTILAIVVLAAALLLLQRRSEKRNDPIGGSPMPVVEQVGVVLPEGATSYAGRQTDNSSPQAVGGAVYGGITLPAIQSAYKGACLGASLQEMLSTHDKYWGFFARNTAFNEVETQKMYNLLADYVGCHAAARADAALCDSLPGADERDGQKVPQEVTPSFMCREKTVALLYEGFRVGLVKDDFPCRATISRWGKSYQEKVSAPEFCKNVSQGRTAALPYLLKNFTMAEIGNGLPLSEKDCGKDEDCLRKYALYKGLKSGNYRLCPAEYEMSCKALLESSAAPCENILKEMSQHYCNSVARVKKKTVGFIGMSKEEIKAEIERVKAEKSETDATKKEEDRLQAEVNKQVKEMLKKEVKKEVSGE
jgi:hypothetical protein